MKRKYLILVAILGVGIVAVSSLWFNRPIGNDEKAVTQVEQTTEITNEAGMSDNIAMVCDVDSSWAFDPSVVSNLLGDNRYVVQAHVTDIGVGAFFGDTPYPYTSIVVTDVVGMEDTPSDLQEIYMPGGIVCVYDFIQQNPSSAEKSKLTLLSEDEQHNQYISYKLDGDYTIQEDTDYMFILRKDADQYIIMAQGYGVFESADTSTYGLEQSSSYVNVLTGNAFEQ